MRAPRRPGAAGALALVVLAAVALDVAPAAADPPRPTDDRSTVERIDPPVAGVDLRVVGGDAFLRLAVDEGVTVEVPGYGGEPYLRVHPDGTVDRNQRSRATYLNEDRLGAVAMPDDLDPDDDPVWQEVAADGTYAWHDHRIHWMSPDRPPGLGPGDVIDPSWEVPLVVDGVDVTATGTLVWEEGGSPLPWLAVTVVVAAGAVALARWRRALASVAALVASLAATGVGMAEWSSVPEGAGGSPLVVVVPAAAAAAAAVAVALRRRPAGSTATLVAVAGVLGWAGLRVGVFLHPVLPTELEPDLDRAGTALAAGLALAAAVVVLARPATPSRS